MNEKEVKDFIGEDQWDNFLKWMRGQTIGLSEDGGCDYFIWDVERFHRSIQRYDGP